MGKGRCRFLAGLSVVGLIGAFIPPWATAETGNTGNTAKPAAPRSAGGGTTPKSGPVPRQSPSPSQSSVAQPNAPPAPGTGAPPAGLGAIAQAAAQSGVRLCLSRIEQITGFLAGNGAQGAMIFADPATPDQSLLSISQEISGPYGIMYASTAYAPAVGGCAGLYEVINFWQNMSCSEVARQGFPSFPRAKPLRQSIEVLDGGPSTKVFMLPVGVSCLTIKKEVLFR